MNKYSSMSNKEKQELLSEFCEALAAIRTTDEAMKFLIDLLTRQEIVTLAKRIKIAKFLIAGKGYREIESLLNVSHGTIAKVGQWLLEAGEGFRLVAERDKDKNKQSKPSYSLRAIEWEKFKQRRPLMFWPELLVKDIIKVMDRRQKNKVKEMINTLNHKSRLYREFSKVF